MILNFLGINESYASNFDVVLPVLAPNRMSFFTLNINKLGLFFVIRFQMVFVGSIGFVDDNSATLV